MTAKRKRPLEAAVISDVHLGTIGCQAEKVLAYLQSIKPKILILNGDIIDIWQFRKSYFPKAHMEVIKEIINMMLNGTEVFYLTGNHDELLRRLPEIHLANFHLTNKLVLNFDGKKAWIFHGDVFDVTMKHSKWLAKLGAVGYDMLIAINCAVNFFSETLGGGRISFSKKIKNSVKAAVKYINDFEQVAAELAIEKQYDIFICGHIHQPQDKIIKNEKGFVRYLNSGDWIENNTSLEYDAGVWSLFHFEKDIQGVIGRKEETEVLVSEQPLEFELA
jgi:UDP-2,3-diacylglucosamine pyrophosphatase LpxH